MQTSQATKSLKQSGIRAASTRCAAIQGINLGQGVCDIPVEQAIKDAAFQAITDNKSIYSPCEGILPLRKALAEKISNFNKVNYCPETEIIITHGSTGAFISAIETIFNPADEIILFEPFYGYHKNILELKGMSVKAVSLNLQDLSFDMADLENCLTSQTKGMVICTPNNPAGKVYSKAELIALGEFAKKHNLWIITDEIYEYIAYPGHQHISIASLADYRERTITISGFSKTYNMTGWRLGYATGPAHVVTKMALVQDLIYVCPTTPLQYAGLAALKLPENYYTNMAASYLEKRDYVVESLNSFGFKVNAPQGAYYLLADFSELGFADDETAAKFLLEEAKVASVPGRYFYINPEHGKHILRFCYALDKPILTQAMQQLKTVLKRQAVA